MKYTLTAIALAAAILAGWQNRKLRDLHETEATHLATQSIEPSVSSNAPEHGEVDPPPSNRAPLSEAEMTVFVASVIAEKVKFETGLYHSVRDILETTFPAICQTLERVTPAQLGALVDAWPHTAEKENDRNNGIYRFLLLAAELNPSATAELSISPLQKEASQVAEKAMKYWFKRDLPDFLKWARENDIEHRNVESARWVAAATIITDQSTETDLKFLRTTLLRYAEEPLNELLLKLPTQEARLRFFRSVQNVTGGRDIDAGRYVWKLAERLPFSQLAHLVDETPPLVSSLAEGSSAGKAGFPQALGSLRVEVAIRSRDASPSRRWQWLTQRPQDRPTGKLLDRLTDIWCRADYEGTANWVRSLPKGTERDAVVTALARSLRWQGASMDIRQEWEAK